MDPSQLGELIAQRKWVAVAAIVIFFVVRVLKSDTKLPFDLPRGRASGRRSGSAS